VAVGDRLLEGGSSSLAPEAATLSLMRDEGFLPRKRFAARLAR